MRFVRLYAYIFVQTSRILFIDATSLVFKCVLVINFLCTYEFRLYGPVCTSRLIGRLGTDLCGPVLFLCWTFLSVVCMLSWMVLSSDWLLHGYLCLCLFVRTCGTVRTSFMVSELLVVVCTCCRYVCLVHRLYVGTVEVVFLGFCQLAGNVTLRNLTKLVCSVRT